MLVLGLVRRMNFERKERNKYFAMQPLILQFLCIRSG